MEKILKESLFFKSCSQEQIKKITDISSTKDYLPNQTIFFEGDDANGLYFVKKGTVKIFKTSFDGKEQILHIFGKGEPFGEVAVFSGTDFPANAQAINKTQIIYIPKENIIDIFKNDPQTAMNIIAVLSIRLKQFTTLIENLSLKELPERLASYIIQQNSIQGLNGNIILEFSKGQLAKILGTTQESLSRTLTKFSKLGLIETNKRNIKLLDIDKLNAIADGAENIKNLDNNS